MFGVLRGQPNITLETANAFMAELRSTLDEAPDEKQRVEVEFWLRAAELRDSKCNPSFESDLLDKFAAGGLERANLRLFVDGLLLAQASYCINSEPGAQFYLSISAALERAGPVLASFKLDDGSISFKRIADHLAPDFDPLWPGLPPNEDSETFNEICDRKLINLCVDVCLPYESNQKRTIYLLKSMFTTKIDPENRVYEWYELVLECKRILTNIENVFYEMPDAVTRYQFYEAPLRHKGQLAAPDADDQHYAWAHLFEQVFKAAPANVIAPMTLAQVIDALNKLGAMANAPNVPQRERNIVKYWLEHEQSPKRSLCEPDSDDWLRYHASLGLPGVGLVHCNFKLFVEHVRRKHFDMCADSVRYQRLRRRVDEIAPEQIALMKSIKPVGAYSSISGMFSVARAARYLAGLVKRAPLKSEQFNKLYNTEIYLKCQPIVAIRYTDSLLTDYLSDRYFADRLNERVRDWLAAESSCWLLTSPKGKKLLFESLQETLLIKKKGSS